MKTAEQFHQEFLLHPDTIFFHHGSFGACPRPVFEKYQEWQRILERQPVDFCLRRFGDRMLHARSVLSEFVHCNNESIVYLPNSTHGVNIAARSIPLQEGDEIVSTNHEYGGCDKLWTYLCNLHGSIYKQIEIPIPVQSHQDIINTIWAAVTKRTKVLFLSEITSPTAIHFPIVELCKRAREAGIITIVDASHSPGQIPINIDTMEVDFYIANCHKWLCSPKGAGFLYASPFIQHIVQPLTVSWGWNASENDKRSSTESDFVQSLEWMGATDISAYLTVPSAIEYQQEHNWNEVVTSCNVLTESIIDRLCQINGINRFCSTLTTDGRKLETNSWNNAWYVQMATLQLPPCNVTELKGRLLEQHNVEVVIQYWNNIPTIRFSVQAYTTERNADILIQAIHQELPYCIKTK